VSGDTGMKKIDMGPVFSMLKEEQVLARMKFRAQGGSMVPLIRGGDIVTVVPADAANLHVGDIVIYHTGDLAIVHRMLYQYMRGGSTWLLTKGDALPVPDKPVHAGRVIGRVVSVERMGRRLDFDRPVMRALSLIIAMISPAAGRYVPSARRLKRILGKLGFFQ
jgi:signal peptidase I